MVQVVTKCFKNDSQQAITDWPLFKAYYLVNHHTVYSPKTRMCFLIIKLMFDKIVLFLLNRPLLKNHSEN